jgi:DNA-binding beta-propeller fold protein YncE
MIKKSLFAAAAAVLLTHAACAASWEVIAGAPVAVHAGPLEHPRGIAVGRDDTIYFTDGASVRALRPDGKLATLPGRFIAPAGLALAADGALYVSDEGNHVVKRIAPDGAVATVAGQAGTAGRQDGKGIAARFSRPAGLALDAAGNLLVADAGNSALRRIAPNGTVGTVAARLPLRPQGVTVDARGAAVVHDAAMALRIDAHGTWRPLDMQPPREEAQQEGNGRLRAGLEALRRADIDVGKLPGEPGECLRGKCLRRYLAPSMPAVPRPRDQPPGQMSVDAQGRLLATVPSTGTIYRLDHDGMIVPLLGAGDVSGELSGAAVGRDGRLRVLLAERQAAATWSADGKYEPLNLQYAASLNRDGPALRARFSDITQLAVGRDGGLYVLDGDQLRRIDKSGEVRTLLQEGGFQPLRDARTSAQVDLHGSMVARSSTGVFVTANGTLAGVSTEGLISFVSGPPGMAPEQTGFVPALRRIWAYVSQDAEPFVLPGLGRHRIASDAAGQAWYCADNVLWRVRPRGVARRLELKGKDGCGDVLVAPNDEVFMLHGHYMTRVGADGHQLLAAGSRERKGSADGTALRARLRRMTHAVPDANNNIHFLDDGILRKMSANGEITTEVKDLFAAVGKLRALAVDRKGVLYVSTGRTILRIKP